MTTLEMRASEIREGAFTLADVRGIVRRRWLMVAIPLLIGAPLAIGVAMILPPVYVSTARILVESQQIPDELAQSTVGQSAGERIQLIRQRLLTRENLLDIANRYNVYADRPDLSASEIVSEMRAATSMQSSGGRRSGVTGLDISFSASNPAIAARVANDFVSRILQQNVEDRTLRAQGTLEFFNEEVRRLGSELEATAARIARYKSENQIALPQSLSTRVAEISTIEERKLSRASERAALEERILLLNEVIASNGSGIDGRGASALEQELVRLRNTLVTQSVTLAPTHPTIRQLQARIAAIETALQTGATSTDFTSARRVQLAEEQIASVTEQLELLDARDARDAERLEELRASVALTPQVEMELASLNRTLSGLQTQYREAVLKQARAETGERLEAGQRAERFEVIEQAIASDTPDSPNRRLIAMAGIVASGGVGVVLAALAELLNRAIRTPRDLERRLELRPIVTIPYIMTESEVARRRWIHRSLAVAVLAGVPIFLLLVDQYYRPLPLIAERLMDVTGIERFLQLVETRLGR